MFPRALKSTMEGRALRYQVPLLWNQLPFLALEDREPFYFYTQLLYSHLLHKFSLLLLPVWVSASHRRVGLGGGLLHSCTQETNCL